MVSPPVLSSEVSVLHRSCLTHHPDGPSSLPSRSGPWTPGLRDPPVSSGSRGSCTWPPAGGVYVSPTFLAAWQPAGWNQSLPLESNSLLTLYSSRCGEAGGADMSPNQIRVDPQHCKLALPSWRVTVWAAVAGCWAVSFPAWEMSTRTRPSLRVWWGSNNRTDKNSAGCWQTEASFFSIVACLLVQMS